MVRDLRSQQDAISCCARVRMVYKMRTWLSVIEFAVGSSMMTPFCSLLCLHQYMHQLGVSTAHRSESDGLGGP